MSQTNKHGTTARYSAGCRCSECKKAHAEYHREYMRNRPGLNAAYMKSRRMKRKRGRPARILKSPENLGSVRQYVKFTQKGSEEKLELGQRYEVLLPEDYFYVKFIGGC